MTSPASIIRRLLIAEGLGAASGTNWPIFVSFLPNDPDRSIAVYDTAGIDDGRLMATGERIVHSGIQVRVRGPVYPDVWEKAESIARKLDEQARTSIVISASELYLIHNVTRTGDIIPMGIEEDGDRRRHNFTVNAIVTIKKGII